jgi:hypothetical protein
MACRSKRLNNSFKFEEKQKYGDGGEGGRGRGEKRQQIIVVEAAGHHGGADARKQDGKWRRRI